MSRPGTPGAGPISGTNVFGKRGRIGTPVGQRPVKRGSMGDVTGTAQPLTAALDAGTAGARPIGQPTLDVRGRYPGTQPIGRKGTGLPRGPDSFTAAARGSGLMGALSLPPRPVRATPGWITNHKKHYQLVLRRHADNFDRFIEKSMPTFRFLKEIKDPVSDDVAVLAPLPLVNYILRAEHDASIPDKTAPDILKEWGYFGVVQRAERNSSNSVNGYMETLETVQSVHGETLVFNVWGTKIRSGTPLWFILKMVDNIPDEFILDPNGNQAQRVYADHEIPKRSFQFVPWADNQLLYPPDDVVMYRDNDDRLRRGARLYVGRLEWEISHKNERASRSSAWNAHAMVTGAGQMWILGDERPAC